MRSRGGFLHIPGFFCNPPIRHGAIRLVPAEHPMNQPTLVLALAVAGAAQVSAFSFSVRSTADSGALTLREAVAAANASTDAERIITFNPTLVPPGSNIALLSPIEITKPMTIQGHVVNPLASTSSFGAGAIRISAASGRAFTITSAATGASSIQYLNFEICGTTSTDGGAVHLSGSGVQVDFVNCVFAQNDGDRGGAIFNDGAALKSSACVFYQNTGIGGAVQTIGGGTFTANRSKFLSNDSPQNGGAVVVLGASGGTFKNCLFSENHATLEGGGISAGGAAVVDVLNCTFTENSTSTYDAKSLRSAVTTGSFTVTNSIIAGSDKVASGNFVSGGHNIVSDITGSSGFGPALVNLGQPRETDIVGPGNSATASASIFRDIVLGTIGYTSTAWNAGDTVAAASLTYDLYGYGRVHGNAVDIGCYEARPDFTVTNTADSGAGSLRKACEDANVSTLEDPWIAFDYEGAFATPATITLTTGGVTLGAEDAFLDGGAAARVQITNTSGGSILDLRGDGVIVQDINIGPSAGSGILVDMASFETATLKRVTVRNCASTYLYNGGILHKRGELTLSNCTISGNSPAGIWYRPMEPVSSLTVVNCTITGNSSNSNCPGINTGGDYSGSLSFGNCIVAGNTSTGSPNLTIIGPVGTTNLGHNLLSQPFFAPNNDIIAADPRLAPLAANGHRTLTHALLLDSPAIDGGAASFASGPGVPIKDQTETARSGVTDIGAREWTPIDYTAWKALVFTTTPAPQQGPGGDPDGDGIINGLEFQMGTNPTVPTAAPWSGGMENGNLVFRYPVARGRVLGTSVIEVSTNLTNWNPATATPVFESVSGVRDLMKVTLQANQSRRFVRLGVTF